MGMCSTRSLTLSRGEVVAIQHATERHVDGLVAMDELPEEEGDLSFFAGAFGERTPEQRRAGRQHWVKWHRDEPGFLCLVATSPADGVIALLNLSHIKHPLRQHRASLDMFVLPAWRDLGLGRAMLMAAIDWATACPQIERIGLKVVERNHRALHLYRSSGFKEEGRIIAAVKTREGDYVDEILMGMATVGH